MDLSKALQMASLSDAGRVRTHNEDAVFANAALGFAILADGMGGYNAGEVASGIAVTLLHTELKKTLENTAFLKAETGLDTRSVLEAEIKRANTAIHQAALSQPQYAGMGTTLVLALFRDNRLTVAHIGDSRLYRLRGSDFRALTRDHSFLREQLDLGMITEEEARFSQNKNLVTRALGIDPEVEPEIGEYDTLPGDIYLLCSDGLNDMVEDGKIASTLLEFTAAPEQAAQQLVHIANENGGKDNVSVIVVGVMGEYPMPHGWRARLWNWLA